jgi:hypothetical protein
LANCRSRFVPADVRNLEEKTTEAPTLSPVEASLKPRRPENDEAVPFIAESQSRVNLDRFRERDNFARRRRPPKPIGGRMPLAEQFASAIELAPFSDLNALAHKLWKAHAAGQLDDDEAQSLAERLEAKRPKRAAVEPSSFRPVRPPKPKPQRSPDRQASIERRRRLARASPVPPELVDKFTQGEHAALTVVCGEIQRCGLCAWCLAKIAAIAGVCRDVVRNALRKARALGLLHKEERRRRGQKSLTNIVRVLRRSWGHWLKRIGVRKFGTTTDKDQKYGADRAGERSGDSFVGARWSCAGA